MLNRIRTSTLPASPFSPTTATPSRMVSRDEELGKRDDDFRPTLKPARTSSLRVANAAQPWKWRKRRLLGVLVALALVYVFVKNIPTDLRPIDERLGIRRFAKGERYVSGGGGGGAPPWQQQKQEYAGMDREPVGAPPRAAALTEAEEQARMHYYEGPIKFYRLAKSLHAIAKTMGARAQNRNVLFAASSLKSVANLMPMACEMGRWDRNYVHLAITGRTPLSMEAILEINGVDQKSCNVYFHDARGDYCEYSTDERARFSVAGAMKHIQDFMHPQAVIMDDAELEDEFFVKAIKGKMRDYRKTLIEIPAGRYEDFLWMTRLDSGSLASWHRPSIDVLVHAPQQSSGGLLRLVKSLLSADYAGLKVPSLTIELPSDVEVFAKRFLSRVNWPPGRKDSESRTSGLTLRHRIPASHLSTEQASLRFLESFYPTSNEDNHVLVLSSQIELSPLFLHYLHYVILEYRYSAYSPPNAEALLGAALDVPEHWANGTGTFQVPLVKDMHAHRYTKNEKQDQLVLSPFTYETPSASAGLIFGDKWATLHSFLTNRIAATHLGKAKKTKKNMSERDPSWAEYLLELMRCRSWVMLHPSEAFVTVHNELAQIPEEFIHESRKQSDSADAEDSTSIENSNDEPFLTAPSLPKPPHRTELEDDHTADLRPLHEILSFGGDLPEIPHMPFITHQGEYLHIEDRHGLRDKYIAYFRQTIGGCKGEEASKKRWAREGRTDDLFCLPGLVVEYVEDEYGEDDGDGVEGLDDEEAAKIAEAIVLGTQGVGGEGPSLEKIVPVGDDKGEEGGDGDVPTVETEADIEAQAEVDGDG